MFFSFDQFRTKQRISTHLGHDGGTSNEPIGFAEISKEQAHDRVCNEFQVDLLSADFNVDPNGMLTWQSKIDNAHQVV